MYIYRNMHDNRSAGEKKKSFICECTSAQFAIILHAGCEQRASFTKRRIFIMAVPKQSDAVSNTQQLHTGARRRFSHFPRERFLSPWFCVSLFYYTTAYLYTDVMCSHAPTSCSILALSFMVFDVRWYFHSKLFDNAEKSIFITNLKSISCGLARMIIAILWLYRPKSVILNQIVCVKSLAKCRVATAAGERLKGRYPATFHKRVNKICAIYGRC